MRPWPYTWPCRWPRPRGALACLALLAAAWRAQAAVTIHARVDRYDIDYVVNGDLTYTATSVRDDTLLTARGLDLRDRAAFTFHPATQSVQVLEAWTEEPDGERVPVTASNIFTRPSAAADDSPGFTTTETTTVLFPRLREGAHTHISWRFVQRRPAVTGFNVWEEPPSAEAVTAMRVRITAPEGVALHWGGRGFAVESDVTHGVRHVTARIAGMPPGEPERNMVAWSDVRPLFLAATVPDLAAVGAIYYRQSERQAAPTPALSALATRIAAGRTGREAARAVYDYVARRIRYVAIYLDPESSWIPHPAEEVLRQGYGDCKDHVVLMQALLAALGIRAEPVLIDWSDAYRPLPIATPWAFNHVIVWLPDYHLYANPTDPYAPFGALDRRLAGKQAVLATPDGEAVTTPPSTPADETYRWDAQATVLPDGTIDGQARMTVSPRLESDLRDTIADAASLPALADRMLAATPEGGTGDITATDPRDLDIPFTLSATWHSPHGLPLNGRVAYLTVPVGVDFKRIATLRDLVDGDPHHRYPVIAGARDYAWRIALRLPPGRMATDLPPPVDVDNAAGSYRASYALDGDTLTVTRRLVIDHDVYSPSQYEDLRALVYAPLDDARSVIPLLERDAAR
ncbi:DUF3857 domain-containing protein [Acidisphaera rubrifaciens]|nr:DUF3857 domain-containing protein [Acidisphaera rubrifaciens]